MPNRDSAPARPQPATVDLMRTLIDARTPRAEAAARVQVSAPHARSAYMAYTRLAGPRDEVLDYAAHLFATDTGQGAAMLKLDAVERDEGGELVLLLWRSLYAGS